MTRPARPGLRAVGLLLLVATAALFLQLLLFRPATEPTSYPLPPRPATSTPTATASPTPTPLFWIDLRGEVRQPGVYQVAPGARLNAAISLAGGLTLHADTRSISLARPIVDGELVVIPARSSSTPNGRPASNASSTTPALPATPTPRPVGLVSINTATQAELESLPGIGPAKAQAILAGRPYRTVEELLRVRGIGEKTLVRLRPHITVR